MKRTTLFFLFSFLFFGTIHSQEKSQIQYIANQGVFIEYNGKKVLIDALHDPHLTYYQETRAAFRLMLTTATAPFEKVDLFLATSALGDHFDSKLTIDFLEKHIETILIAPQQVLDSMGTLTHLEAQFYPLRETDSGLMYAMDGVDIHTFPLKHAFNEESEWVENMAYLLDFEGFRILHVGDANFLPENLNRIEKEIGKGVDYVILPDWFFENKEAIAKVKKQIKAKKFIVAHVLKMKTTTYSRRLKNRVKDFDLDLKVFLNVGELEKIK